MDNPDWLSGCFIILEQLLVFGYPRISGMDDLWKIMYLVDGNHYSIYFDRIYVISDFSDKKQETETLDADFICRAFSNVSFGWRVFYIYDSGSWVRGFFVWIGWCISMGKNFSVFVFLLVFRVYWLYVFRINAAVFSKRIRMSSRVRNWIPERLSSKIILKKNIVFLLYLWDNKNKLKPSKKRKTPAYKKQRFFGYLTLQVLMGLYFFCICKNNEL